MQDLSEGDLVVTPFTFSDGVWVCVLPDGDEVTFVSAAEAARFGINMANSRAGQVFADNFGEDCDVE